MPRDLASPDIWNESLESARRRREEAARRARELRRRRMRRAIPPVTAVAALASAAAIVAGNVGGGNGEPVMVALAGNQGVAAGKPFASADQVPAVAPATKSVKAIVRGRIERRRKAIARRRAKAVRIRAARATRRARAIARRHAKAVRIRAARRVRHTRARARIASNGPARAGGGGGGGDVVARVIAAANRIATKPYKYGGGHGSWNDTGYDCSGSVSYALHGGGLLDSPLDSSGFMSWGAPGPGKHITIYANPGHMYMVVNGRKFDTSGRYEDGSRWGGSRSPAGYTVRHPPGY